MPMDLTIPGAQLSELAAVRGELKGEECRLLAKRLTPRERDVAIRVAKGLTNKVAELTRFVMETELSDD